MIIAIAADHRGHALKSRVSVLLSELGHEVVDMGTNSTRSCDYPDMAYPAAKAVADKRVERAILIDGNGLGMSMGANKVPGVRAALCHDELTAEMSRRHNDANVLCLGARVVDERMVEDLVRLFVHTPFEGGRHLRRVKKINDVDRAR